MQGYVEQVIHTPKSAARLGSQTTMGIGSVIVEETRNHPFQSLTAELEKSIYLLKDEIMSLGCIIAPAMLPESPSQLCEAKDGQENVVSSIENWALQQLRMIRQCNEMIVDYKSRCVL